MSAGSEPKESKFKPRDRDDETLGRPPSGMIACSRSTLNFLRLDETPSLGSKGDSAGIRELLSATGCSCLQLDAGDSATEELRGGGTIRPEASV